jgi:SH3-like domain-containing protein
MKLILAFLLLFALPAHAQVIGEVTKLPIPRFASLNADQSFARSGPGTRFPIAWVYQRKHLPIEIVQEFDTWRKIRDIDGEEGWVHQSLLSGRRYAIQNTGQPIPILKSKTDDSRIVAMVESGAVLKLNECESPWCNVSASGFRGWISTLSIWGVYEGEQIQ